MALRYTVSPRTAATGLVPLLMAPAPTSCPTIPVLCTQRTSTTGATEGLSAAWRNASGVTGNGGKDASGADTTNGIDLYGSTNVKYSTNGSTLLNTNPYYFVRSGDVGGSTLYNFATYGHYWSSTAVSGSYAYNLYYGSGGLYPALQYSRVYGRSLRCVAR